MQVPAVVADTNKLVKRQQQLRELFVHAKVHHLEQKQQQHRRQQQQQQLYLHT